MAIDMSLLCLTGIHYLLVHLIIPHKELMAMTHYVNAHEIGANFTKIFTAIIVLKDKDSSVKDLLLNACRNEHIDFKLANVLNNISCLDVFMIL